MQIPQCELAPFLALGQLGDDRSLDAIINAVNDPETEYVVAITLGKFKDPRIISPLKQLLSSKDAKVRQSVIISLGALKDPSLIRYFSPGN